MNADIVGWFASAVLLATLIHQIATERREAPKEVSMGLFIGQTLASACFVLYSVLVGNWVFIVTNALILSTSVVGALLAKHRRHAPTGRLLR